MCKPIAILGGTGLLPLGLCLLLHGWEDFFGKTYCGLVLLGGWGSLSSRNHRDLLSWLRFFSLVRREHGFLLW